MKKVILVSKKIDCLCSTIVELLHKAELYDGIAFLDTLTEIDKYCTEILEDEEAALQSERFKSLVIYKCRLFDRKKSELIKNFLFIHEQCENLLKNKNDSVTVNNRYQQYCEMKRNVQEKLVKFENYEMNDNRTLIRIEDDIEYERKNHKECGFSNESFHPFYRIKDYKKGKYTLCTKSCDYNLLTTEQLQKELEKEKEELEELEIDIKKLEDLDENEKLEKINDAIYFCKCNIELIEKNIEEKDDIYN